MVYLEEGHHFFSGLSRRRVLTAVALGSIPWLAAVGFESATFWAGVALRGDIYGLFSGIRLPVDIGSFLLGGVLVSRLVRARLALIQAGLNVVVFWVFLYAACFTFISPNGLMHSNCYQVGPDGLEGYRLGLFMFSLEAFPILMTLAEKRVTIPIRIRPWTAVLSGIVAAVMTSWFSLAAWFSGVVFLPFFEFFQVLVLFGVPAIAAAVFLGRGFMTFQTGSFLVLSSLLFFPAFLLRLSSPSCVIES